MVAVRGLLAVLGAGLLVAGCGNPTATFERVVAGDPARPYLGKTKAEIVACAGAPSATIDRGGSEVLIYHYSGPGPVPGVAKKKEEGGGAQGGGAGAGGGLFGAGKKDKSWQCSASVTFENGRLTKLTFAPRDVESPYATKKNAKTKERVPVKQPEPCTFVLPACGG
jgi:hypothetical protein